VQYGDYALWQRKQMSGERLSEGLEFWRRLFEGAEEPLKLPVDGNGGPDDDWQGGLVSVSLGEELTRGLAALSERAGVSLFVVLLSGFKAWLHGRTGQRDLVVCTPVSGRSRRELRHLIGYFNNIVPMRTKVLGKLTVSELLERVSRGALEVQPYQDVPFQKIAEIPAERGLSLRRCLFGVQNTPSRPLAMGDVSMRRFRAGGRSMDFDLSLSIWREGETWSVTARYRASLFEEETIERMLREYRGCLELMSQGGELRIEDLVKSGGRRGSILARLMARVRLGI
jgi:non-ribosomal peptide synthetase component F